MFHYCIRYTWPKVEGNGHILSVFLLSDFVFVQGEKYPPALMICAYQDQWREANSTISFDKITIEYPLPGPGAMRNNSHPDTSEVRPTMEPESGTFRCPRRGFYRVTFSGGADRHPGKVTGFLFHILNLVFLNLN